MPKNSSRGDASASETTVVEKSIFGIPTVFVYTIITVCNL